MSNKHTPGPWTVTADGAGWYIECSPERGHSVAYIRAEIGEEDPDTSDNEKEANARLIAAAPELLEALSKFVEFAELHGEVVFAGGGMTVIDAMNACTTKARAAIAKAARGQS